MILILYIYIVIRVYMCGMKHIYGHPHGCVFKGINIQQNV